MTKTTIAVTIDDKIIKALDEKAEEESRSRSSMVNVILKKSLIS